MHPEHLSGGALAGSETRGHSCECLSLDVSPSPSWETPMGMRTQMALRRSPTGDPEYEGGQASAVSGLFNAKFRRDELDPYVPGDRNLWEHVTSEYFGHWIGEPENETELSP